MTTRRRKVTYSLPEELLDAVAGVVRDGAAPSYSAFVEDALRERVDRARKQALARAFDDAADDPLFLADVEETMEAFRHADREADAADE